MDNFLWSITGAVIILGASAAFFRSRDAFHPAIALAPPFLFFYCVWPILLNRNDAFYTFLPESSFLFASTVFLFSITALYAGLLHHSDRSGEQGAASAPFIRKIAGDPLAHRRLYYLAFAVGGISLLAYGSTFDFNPGQFIRGYSRYKGGGRGVSSGYIGEAMTLCLPAVLILAMAVRARGRLMWRDVIVALVLISPMLFQGTLGGRRGPLFMSLATLFFAWFVASGRRPTIQQAVIGLSAIGFLIFAVYANRGDVYLGSGNSFDVTQGVDAIVSDDVSAGNEYVAGTTYIETRRRLEDYYWGYRYLVTVFVRPIPSVIWPTKYADVGADWVDAFGDESLTEIYLTVGYFVPKGSSTGSIADGFAEFSWGVVGMFYLLGRAFSLVWRRHRVTGGFWTVLLFLMLALSVYLPSQSFSAWFVRAAFAGLGSYLLWILFLGDIKLSETKLTPVSTAGAGAAREIRPPLRPISSWSAAGGRARERMQLQRLFNMSTSDEAKPVRRVRVGHLYSILQRSGGIERIIQGIAVGGRKHGVSSHIFLFSRLPDTDQLDVPGAKMTFPKFASFYARLARVAPLRPVAKMLARTDLTFRILGSGIEILHIHRGMDQSSVITALVCRAFGIRIVRTIHGNLPEAREQAGIGFLRWCNKRVAAFVALTPDGKDYALEHRPIEARQIEIIPNGVDVEQFEAARDRRDEVRRELEIEDAFVILMVARLDVRQKDFFTLLRAFEKFAADRPSARLLLCGEGSGRAAIADFIAERGMGDRVRMLGFYSDLPRLMAGADVFAFSTFHEGFGIVAAEAMAARLPVVASDIVGLRTVCDQGRAAILVKPEDADDMAGAFARLYDDKALRERLVEAGAAHVRREYSADVMVERYCELYRKIARERRRPAPAAAERSQDGKYVDAAG